MKTHNHKAEIARLGRLYAHGIDHVASGPLGNCLSHALDISTNRGVVFVMENFGGEIHTGADFAHWILTRVLIGVPEKQIGALVMYFCKDEWRHAGVNVRGGRIVSKWGLNPVYEHNVWEVPIKYGDSIRTYAMPSKATALSAFREFAASHSAFKGEKQVAEALNRLSGGLDD